MPKTAKHSPNATLVISLIFTEIVGILFLIWILRVPLAQKFLLLPPQNFEISKMDTSKQYLLHQGDFLTGQTEPNSQIQMLLSPLPVQAIVTSNPGGNFQFQIPQETPPQEYLLTITDNNGNNILKTLRVRIAPNSRVNQFFNSVTLQPS